MQNKSLHYAQYLSGIISEEQFYEIEQQLHENMLRNAIGAGAMALGGLFGGPNNIQAQSPSQNSPAITAKSDFDVDGNDEDVYHNVDTYVKDLIKKLKFNKYNFESKYNRGQSKIIIQKVIKAEKQQNGDVYVTISGMARGTQGALAGKVQEAIKDRDLMGAAGSIQVYGLENSGKYIGQVPQDVQSPGTDLYPFTATVQISK
jgi:hypothetical protein